MSAALFYISLLAISALLHLMPRITRPDLYFGVTVDPALRISASARRILQRYRFGVWCSTLAAVALQMALQRPAVSAVLYAVGIGGAQLAAHHSTLAHAIPRATAIEIDLSAPPEHFPGGFAAAALPFVLLLFLGTWSVSHVDRLPGRLPVHWSFAGPDHWVTTSPRLIVMLVLLHAISCLVLMAAAWGVLHGSRRICASGPAAAAERRFRRRTLLMLLTVAYFSILPPALALLQAPVIAMRLWSAALAIMLLGFIVTLLRAGQGGARLFASRPPVGDRTADDRWLGGFIYINRADPALLVEKRMGIGWTLNFGNPWSWLLIAMLVAMVPTGHYLLR